MYLLSNTTYSAFLRQPLPNFTVFRFWFSTNDYSFPSFITISSIRIWLINMYILSKMKRSNFPKHCSPNSKVSSLHISTFH